MKNHLQKRGERGTKIHFFIKKMSVLVELDSWENKTQTEMLFALVNRITTFPSLPPVPDLPLSTTSSSDFNVSRNICRTRIEIFLTT